ncbi:hypothetical protein T265_01337 [Opisthorchis viverrini]|uniref:FAM13A-like domain-containing protein n=1 Tax=Opisthorchis viverrini TaxID=6198 RepID=A0A075A028_OPIVI|nr:hypothetical protein T265_01337 [Opisthorchis viverrini]KER32651.1 hypothetical protein T265_01337 [Opisthorchis viverrini]
MSFEGAQGAPCARESLSNSTTLGFPKSSQPKLHPTGSTDNDITGTSILQSPTTWQTEDLSAGLAAAIRVCIEEHVLGPTESYSDIQPCVTPDSVTDKHANFCTNSQPTFSPSYEACTLPSRGRLNSEPQANFSDAKTPIVTSSTLDTRDNFGHNRSPVRKSLTSTAPDTLLQLTQRLHLIKSQVRDYERNFEATWGRKPNFMEKRAESRVRKLLDELTEIRTQIKQARIVTAETVEGPQSPAHDAVEHEVDHLRPIPSTPDPTDEAPIPRSDVQVIHDSGKKHRQLNGTSQMNDCPAQGSATLKCLQGASSVWDPKYWSSEYNTTTTGMLAHTLPSLSNAPSAAHSYKASNPARSSEASLTETYELLIHRLAEKRASARRPEDLTLMNPKQVFVQAHLLPFLDLIQIESEKLAIQKALLYFESLHGRPRTREERLIMRPIYDRYRAVKRLLSATTQDERPLTANPPTEGQISGSDTRATDLDSEFCSRGTHIISSELDEVESITRTSFRRPTSAHPHLHMDTRTCLLTQPPHRVGTASTYSMNRRKSQPGINSGDDESPSLLRQSQQQFTWNTRVSTIPRPVQLAEEVELQLPPPDSTGRNEWCKFNEKRLTFYQYFVESSTCVPSATVTSEENIRPSPSREFPSSTPLLRTTSVSTSTRAKDELNGLVSDKPDVRFARSEPPLMNQQKSSHDIRAVSSPSEFISTITASEWTLIQLQDELQSVQDSKRHLQKILKDFEHEFMQATGHKVERNDRLCMRAEYAQYKVLKTRLHQLETELESRTG